MTDLQRVSLRLFEELTALVQEMDPAMIPQRGQALTAQMNALGERAARHWVETGSRPSHPEELAAWFPRLWFASSYLRHAVLHETRTPSLSADPKRLPAVLMLEVWEQAGRKQWESPKPEMPWGG